MAVISEISGEDRNKNTKEEEENKSKKPQEVAVVNNGSSTSFPFPDDVTETILALVGRCNYPKIALVSSDFHRLITKPELYKERLRLGVTETILYVLIGFPFLQNPSLYILDTSKIDSFRLGRINSLPRWPLGCAVVTIGSFMYIIGGYLGEFRSWLVIRFDCVSHTYDFLPHMLRVRARAAAGVIDGKIYVIGGCEMPGEDWAEVFDFETRVWSPVPGPYPYACTKAEFTTYVVMEEKVYISGPDHWWSYEPKQDRWEQWSERSDLSKWHESCCVVDDRLYTIDTGFCQGSIVIVYDPKTGRWRPVNGVHISANLPNNLFDYDGSRMVNLGGKLVILGGLKSQFYPMYYRVLLIEIALEIRQDGEIWGKVESLKPLLSSWNVPAIELCRTVTV